MRRNSPQTQPGRILARLVSAGVAILAAASIGQGATPAPAPPRDPAYGMLRKVSFDQNLNAQLPLDVNLRDEQGKAVRLGSFFGKRPVILTLVYYRCPMLCTKELNGLLSNLSILSLDMGKDYDVISLSIDPTETPELASAKKTAYVQRYNRPTGAAGWHFLTGDEASIAAVAGVAGFHYQYDPKSGQYAHPAGIMIVTPEGKIARYFYGVEYPARDLRLGLIEASSNKIGSAIDQVLLICYHYDPKTGRYNFAIMSLLRLLCTATVAGLGTFMFVMFRRDWRVAKVSPEGV